VPREPWSMAELRTFLIATADDRLAGLWTVYLGTGPRRGEALGLRWSDIDLDAGTLTVRRNRTCAQTPTGRTVYDDRPKTKSSLRTVPLEPSTVAALRRHRAAQHEERLAAGSAWVDEDRVFASEIGAGLDPDAVSIQWRDACHAADENGVLVEVIARRLGHSRSSTTSDLYCHPNDAQQRAAADIFGRLMSGEG
jgi:integrase